MSEYLRNRLYPTTLSLAALAVAYGWVTEERAALWVALVVALGGDVVATIYRPRVEGRRKAT